MDLNAKVFWFGLIIIIGKSHVEYYRRVMYGRHGKPVFEHEVRLV